MTLTSRQKKKHVGSYIAQRICDFNGKKKSDKTKEPTLPKESDTIAKSSDTEDEDHKDEDHKDEDEKDGNESTENDSENSNEKDDDNDSSSIDDEIGKDEVCV